tara:strand:+ start:242 stop:496 length:255 start_codon:yes stop_codon:yes gene_type:complete
MSKITAKVTNWTTDNYVAIVTETSRIEVEAADSNKFNVQTTLYLKAEEAIEAASQIENAVHELVKQQEIAKEAKAMDLTIKKGR